MILYVIKNGVPYDVAYALDPQELLAHYIIFARFENGLEWNWDAMRFVDK